jgi:hypothetical protein
MSWLYTRIFESQWGISVMILGLILMNVATSSGRLDYARGWACSKTALKR